MAHENDGRHRQLSKKHDVIRTGYMGCVQRLYVHYLHNHMYICIYIHIYIYVHRHTKSHNVYVCVYRKAGTVRNDSVSFVNVELFLVIAFSMIPHRNITMSVLEFMYSK